MLMELGKAEQEGTGREVKSDKDRCRNRTGRGATRLAKIGQTGRQMKQGRG